MAQILVIDDEQEWLELCRETLEHHGHEVTTVSDASKALRMMRSKKPSLVILDIAMPLNGRTVLQALLSRLPSVPVIIYSAYRGYSDDPDFSRATDYVVKSTDATALVRAVAKALKNGQ